MNPTTEQRAAERAAAVARELERRCAAGDPAELDLLEDVCELEAHPDGALILVLEVRGPHVALVLGRGAPHVEVWWGGSSAEAPVQLDAAAVQAFLATWWAPASAASMS
jgi:hypothetical protein